MRPKLLALLTGCVTAGLLTAANPDWWTDPNTAIIDPEAAPAPLAPVTLGQLKHVAQQAASHLDDRLEDFGGAGPTIDSLIAGFVRDDPVNLAPATIGQVKAVAYPFYARLLTVGFDTRANLIARGYPVDDPGTPGVDESYPYPFPWDPTDPTFGSLAPAVQGQLKMTFSFDLANFDPASADFVDSDGDGLSDLAEIWLLGTNPLMWDTDGDGIADGAEVALGTNPLSGTSVPPAFASGDIELPDWLMDEVGDVRAATNPRLDSNDDPVAVGATSGQLTVDESGALTYRFDLDLPPGTKGVMPELSLKYSSNGGNGILGVGWSLQGLSVITRGPSNMMLYGVNDNLGSFKGQDPVDFTSTDRFYLDGQRLISVSGTYGGDGTQYRTSIESFTKVVSHGSTGTGPERFEVTTRDGLVMEYGRPENQKPSRLLHAGSAVLWLLNRVRDRDGNYYFIEYDFSGNETPKVSRIFYTGNANTNPAVVPYVRIDFSYENRPDGISYFLAGAEQRIHQRMASIEVWYDGAMEEDGSPVPGNDPRRRVSRYEMSYETTAYTGRSRLNGIRERAGDDTVMPMVRFEWEEGSVGFESQNVQVIETIADVSSSLYENTDRGDFSAYSNTFFVADVTGDGISELVRVYVTAPIGNLVMPEITVFKLNEGTVDKKYEPVTTKTVNPSWGYYLLQVIVRDFDGDGLADVALVFVTDTGDSSVAKFILLKSQFSGGVHTFGSQTFVLDNTPFMSAIRRADYQLPWSTETISRPAIRVVPVTNRVDGVERTELLVLSRIVKSSTEIDSIDIVRFLGGGLSFNNLIETQITSYTKPKPNERLLGVSATGVGMPEILVFSGSGYRNGASVFSYRNQSFYKGNSENPYLTGAREIIPVDLNGDGLSDLLTFSHLAAEEPYMGDGFEVYMGKGDQYVNQARDFEVIEDDPQNCHFLPNEHLLHLKYRHFDVFDLNGDGLDDFIIRTKSQYSDEDIDGPGSFSGAIVLLTRYDGNGDLNFHEITLSEIGEDDVDVTPMFTDRSGVPGVLVRGKDESGNRIWRIHRAASSERLPGERIARVLPAVGPSAGVAYSTTLDPTVYFPGGAVGGLSQVSTPTPVVQSISYFNEREWNLQNPPASLYQEDFFYEGLRGQPEWETSVFAAIEITDTRTGLTHRTERAQAHPLTGFVTRRATYRGELPLEEQVITPASKALKWGPSGDPDRTHFVYPGETIVRRWDLLTNEAATDKLGTSSEHPVSVSVTVTTFDDYGNPLVTTTEVRTPGSEQEVFEGRKSTITREYFPVDLTDWYLGRVERVTTVAEATGRPTVTRVAEFTYRTTGDKAMVASITQDPGVAAIKLEIEAEFDAFGNINQVSMTGKKDATLPQTRIQKTRWDAQGRFPYEYENALGHVTQVTHSPLHGGITWHKDLPNDLETSWTYNAFGQLERIDHPDETVTEIARRWLADDLGFAVESRTRDTAGEHAASPPGVTIYDVLGRPVRTVSLNADGVRVESAVEYDDHGRVQRESLPYLSFGSALWTTFEYDGIGRLFKQTHPDASTVTTLYNELSLTSQVKGLVNGIFETRTSEVVSNSAGFVVETIENSNEPSGHVARSRTEFTYNAVGQVKTTRGPDGSTIVVTYDPVRSLRTKIVDPNTGERQFWTNAFGEVYQEKDAKNQITSYQFDTLGRLLHRDESDGTTTLGTTWVYDTAPGKGVGSLASVTSDDGRRGAYAESYEYDTDGRLAKRQQTINGRTYTHEVTEFDSLGRARTVRLAAGSGLTERALEVRHRYSNLGVLRELQELVPVTGSPQPPPAQRSLWALGTVNLYGQVQTEYTGNGISTAREFDPTTGFMTGLQTRREAAVLQSWKFTRDSFGNLRKREQLDADAVVETVLRGETFTYDLLDRLTTGVTYAQNGNIVTKDGQSYAYTSGRPHAVTAVGARSYQYDANGNLVGRDNETEVLWTAFDQPLAINRNGSTAYFRYGADRMRIEMDLDGKVTRYAGSQIEERIDGSEIETIFHLFAGGRRVAQVSVTDPVEPFGDFKRTRSYLHGDPLGTMETVSAEQGLSERLSFDPWGKRRSAADWEDPAPERTTGVTRGYTDHEMLESLGLINMNGRLYDPEIGRFLSPDPFVQSPFDGQTYNRYAYARNNPLSNTDPTGYTFQADLYLPSPGYGAYGWGTSGSPIIQGGGGSSWSSSYSSGPSWGYGGGGRPRSSGVTPRMTLSNADVAGMVQTATQPSAWTASPAASSREGLALANQHHGSRGGEAPWMAHPEFQRLRDLAHALEGPQLRAEIASLVKKHLLNADTFTAAGEVLDDTDLWSDGSMGWKIAGGVALVAGVTAAVADSAGNITGIKALWKSGIGALKGMGQAAFRKAREAMTRRATDAAKTALQVAQEGGRHAGFLRNYVGKSSTELRRAISSYEKRIAEHQAKIANPDKFIPNFKQLDPRQQRALLESTWPGDIQRLQEQASILRELLGN